jgi:hypothetical protein
MYVALDPVAFEHTRDSVLRFYAFTGPFARVFVEAVPVGTSAIGDAIKRFQQIGTDELLLFTGVPDLDQVKRFADLIEGEALHADPGSAQAKE